VNFKGRSHLRSVSPKAGSGEDRSAAPLPDNVVSLAATADAREAADYGDGTALAEWTCALAAKPPVVPSPGPDISHDDATSTASSLLDASTALMDAAKTLKLEGNRDIHRRINDLVNEVGEIGTELAGRWDS
jgi:hypothetical protein